MVNKSKKYQMVHIKNRAKKMVSIEQIPTLKTMGWELWSELSEIKRDKFLSRRAVLK